MPRKAQGPRLWLQPARRRAGRLVEQAVWCIRDDSNVKLSTGVLDSDNGRPPIAAQLALSVYIGQKAVTSRTRDCDPSQILIKDVLNIYHKDVGIKHARPKDTRDRLAQVDEFFRDKTLDYLNMNTCNAYVAARGSQSAARRELEDLRAAVRHHWKLGLCTALTPVTLPNKSEPRERWLTRSEAAKLLWAAYRRPKAKHLARFILVGLYTGTRSGAICGAAMSPTEGRGWVDTTHGVFYRKAIGKARTNKRQPSVRIPPVLLSHIRRWQRRNLARESLIEWGGDPVLRVSKGFTALVRAAGLKDVSPHILRHTAITWQAQEGVPPHEICGYFGITMKMFEEVYGHHHPDYQSNAVHALSRRKRTKPAPSNVVRIAG